MEKVVPRVEYAGCVCLIEIYLFVLIHSLLSAELHLNSHAVKGKLNIILIVFIFDF